jgi:hypothetical protein
MKNSRLTNRQKKLILYLYLFRFLNTHQLQKMLGHKNANRTLAWLKDLRERNYVRRLYNRASYEESNKPAIYYLGPKSRSVLQKEKELSSTDLEFIYQEKRRDKKFINRCIFLADIYLFLLSQSKKTEEVNFFTRHMLKEYKYFPDPLPDAFIAIKGEEHTQRYFLDFFEDYTPSFVFRARVKKYLSYFEDSLWQDNTNNLSFPYILFICPNVRLKNHTYHYCKAVQERTFNTEISFFLTTKELISSNKNTSEIWEKVE